MENPTWYPYTREKLRKVLALLDLFQGGLSLGTRVNALRALVSRDED
jgi:hypothetical protein